MAGPRLSDGGRESYHFRRKPKLRPRPPVMVLALAASHQDLMKLRVLMSHHRKNSVREKMIGKKWIIYIYKKKKTPQRMATSEGEALSYGVVSFYRGG